MHRYVISHHLDRFSPMDYFTTKTKRMLCYVMLCYIKRYVFGMLSTRLFGTALFRATFYEVIKL